MPFASRFHKIIAVAYSVVFLCALFLFYFLYQENHESRLNSIQLHLVEQTQALSTLLRVRADAVNAMRSQAEDFLSHHYPQSHLPTLKLCDVEGKNYYYLDISLENFYRVGNITGQGFLKNLTDDARHEIAMAYALNPLFKILKENIKTAVSLSYISKQGFQNLYPWRPSHEIRFNSQRYQEEVFIKACPEQNPKRAIFWTDAFTQKNADDLIVTCAAPVYHTGQFRGVVSLDFMLTSVEYLVDRIHYQDSRLLLVNGHGTVLTDTHCDHDSHTKICKIDQVLPDDLTIEMIDAGEDFILFEAGKYWVFKATTDFSPWRLIFYINAFDLSISTLRTISPGVILALVLATFFLIFSNKLIVHEFIQPAQRLIKHIANQATDPQSSYRDILEPWLSWFNAVSQVFEENRNLVIELERHILELDHKVIERTKAISSKNLELQKAMVDLCKAQNQIVVQEKLAGLGAITAGISHEIKNPLNFILNFTEVCQEFLNELLEKIDRHQNQVPIQEKQDIQELKTNLVENMKRIENHARRADAIVRNMLIYAKGGADSLQPTDLHKLIDENILLAISGFHYQTAVPNIEKEYDLTLECVNVYPQEFGRVLLNIISNACYFLDQKKQKNPNFEPLIKIKTIHLDDTVEIYIFDNGMGIPDGVKKQLFHPFFTTKPSGSGTGLGLSLSYDIIVSQHDGQISVTSKEGVFTEFKIVLPKNLECIYPQNLNDES